jgi:hypothetical protein
MCFYQRLLPAKIATVPRPRRVGNNRCETVTLDAAPCRCHWYTMPPTVSIKELHATTSNLSAAPGLRGSLSPSPIAASPLRSLPVPTLSRRNAHGGGLCSLSFAR